MKHFPLSKNFSISFHKWRQWYQKGLDITLLFHLEYLQNSETWGWQLYCNWSLCYCCLEFLSLSDTFEEHVMLRHQETDHGNCSSKEHPSHRCRIMSNVSYAPLEYVNNHGVLKSLFVFFKSSLLYIPGVTFLSFKCCENSNSNSRNSTCSQTNNLFPLLYCHHHAPVGLPKFQIAPFEPDNFSFIYSIRHWQGWK